MLVHPLLVCFYHALLFSAMVTVDFLSISRFLGIILQNLGCDAFCIQFSFLTTFAQHMKSFGYSRISVSGAHIFCITLYCRANTAFYPVALILCQ